MEMAQSHYLASLHLYDDAIVLAWPNGGPAYCVDPLDIASAMSDVALTTGLLPHGCLFWSRRGGAERLGIYVPAQVWQVHISGEEQQWMVPMPALVFIGQGKRYNVYALKKGTWPEPDTMLYKAPCPNVSEGICTGNVAFPVAGAATIWQAAELFFSSDFNRDVSSGKSQQHGACVLDMWRNLHRQRRIAYPVDDLVSAGVTMREVIDAS